MIEVEGIGDEVVVFLVTCGTLILFSTVYCLRLQRRNHAVHPDELANVDSFRESMEAAPRRRRYTTENQNQPNQCPVCLADIQYEVETNCGHIFCCRCWVSYRNHGNWIGAVRCPVCRQQVTILFQCFTESELHPEEGSEDEQELRGLMQEINSYNRRFSGDPRPLLDYLRDLPTLSRHLWNEFFSLDGLMHMFRLRLLLCFVAGLIYLISPLDIIPEGVYGLFGLIDDVFVLLVVSIYVSILYRSYIAGRND